MIVDQYISQILAALLLIILGGWLYEGRDGFFLSGGSFQGKVAAPLLVLASVVSVVLVTPRIVDLLDGLRRSIGTERMVGFILIFSVLAANNLADWNYLDNKSVLAYVVGFAIIFQTRVVDMISTVVGYL
ncbi:hypothetical protein [Halorubrum sp. Ib24]|uniref:hypothetical protein n=1 Tax=Halorubrum sp. Ib24 TaxID=1383850 RepID=UPI001179D042|nr:hypothetical protein [Halorubrum sp. Ib24]